MTCPLDNLYVTEVIALQNIPFGNKEVDKYGFVTRFQRENYSVGIRNHILINVWSAPILRILNIFIVVCIKKTRD